MKTSSASSSPAAQRAGAGGRDGLVEHFAAQKKKEGRAEGRVEGRAEWRVEGGAQGRAGILLTMLRLKFGDLSADVEARVAAGSDEDAQRWAERILSGAFVHEVFVSGD